MTRVRLDPVLHGERGRVGNALQLTRKLFAVEMSIAPRVKFDDGRTEADGRRDLFLGRLDEQADADLRRAELVDIIGQVIVLARRIEPSLGRSLLATLGDDAGGMGPMPQRDLEHLLGRRPLEVQRKIDFRHQPVDVAVGDVPPILAQMRRDSVRAGLGGHDGRANRIGMIAAARVPDGRDLIDVHPKSKAPRHAAARLPGFIGGIAASSGGSASAS
jgi:hypothetical protein